MLTRLALFCLILLAPLCTPASLPTQKPARAEAGEKDLNYSTAARDVMVPSPCNFTELAEGSKSATAAAPGGQEKQKVTDEQYQKCWEYFRDKILDKALEKTKGGKGKGVKEVLSAYKCLDAKTTAETAKECMGLVCKFAPVPPCKLLEGGQFLESCLAVSVQAFAEAIIPETMARLADEWQGLDCSKTASIESCLTCCSAQYKSHGDENKYLDCRKTCEGKPSLVK